MVEDGSPDDVREVHMQVLGNIDRRGVRLTELATCAGIKPASVSELVDDLEAVGILERRPDPTDGRAKLICMTRQG